MTQVTEKGWVEISLAAFTYLFTIHWFWERYAYWACGLFSLYGADLFKAIFQCHFWNNWNLFYLFFFCKKKEDYLYARYIQRHYWKMSYLRRLFGCLNTFRCPILMHYNFKYRCVGMCGWERREGKEILCSQELIQVVWLVCLLLSSSISNYFPLKVEKIDIST